MQIFSGMCQKFRNHNVYSPLLTWLCLNWFIIDFHPLYQLLLAWKKNCIANLRLKRKASNYSWQVTVTSFQHFPFSRGENRFHKMVWLSFIHCYTVHVSENDGSFNSVVSFCCTAPESYRPLPLPEPERGGWSPFSPFEDRGLCYWIW